jgi:hypothetical protein
VVRHWVPQVLLALLVPLRYRPQKKIQILRHQWPAANSQREERPQPAKQPAVTADQQNPDPRRHQAETTSFSKNCFSADRRDCDKCLKKLER